MFTPHLMLFLILYNIFLLPLSLPPFLPLPFFPPPSNILPSPVLSPSPDYHPVPPSISLFLSTPLPFLLPLPSPPSFSPLLLPSPSPLSIMPLLPFPSSGVRPTESQCSGLCPSQCRRHKHRPLWYAVCAS
ncbi:unnamed protein product [Closterium sp. NIES-54]